MACGALDSSLARNAQDWADQLACMPWRTIDHGNHDGQGQNIAWVGGSSSIDYASERVVATQIEGWWAEANDVRLDDLRRFTTNSVNGKDIGHFTQMAWAKTTKVGCGVSLQTTGGNAALVCAYRVSQQVSDSWRVG